MQTNFYGFYSLARKEVHRVFRIWKQTLLPSVITSALYFLIFGTFIGGQISSVEGIPYIKFIVPGFIMMSIIVQSYSNVSSSFFGSKFNRSVEEILVSPIPDYLVLIAYVVGGIVRGMIVGILIFLVAQFFTDIGIINIPFAFLFSFLTATLFALLGLFNGFFAKSFDDVSIIPTFVITPLTYLGGVFYSLSFLPQIWQTVSSFNPIFYMVNGLRYSFIGYTEVNVYTALLFIIISIIVLFIINLTLLKRGYGLKS